MQKIKLIINTIVGEDLRPIQRVNGDGKLLPLDMYATALQTYANGETTEKVNIRQAYKEGLNVRLGQIVENNPIPKTYGMYKQQLMPDGSWQYTETSNKVGFRQRIIRRVETSVKDIHDINKLITRILYAKGHHVSKRLMLDVNKSNALKGDVILIDGKERLHDGRHSINLNTTVHWKDELDGQKYQLHINNVILRKVIEHEIQFSKVINGKENKCWIDNYEYYFDKRCIEGYQKKLKVALLAKDLGKAL